MVAAAALATVAAANPDFAMDEWRASSKGAEGYTWWLVNGRLAFPSWRCAEWQREFEAAFPYEETPDQRVACNHCVDRSKAGGDSGEVVAQSRRCSASACIE